MVTSSITPYSISRVAALGIKGYDSEKLMYTAFEQASQPDGCITFVASTKRFYQKNVASNNSHISDYTPITAQLGQVTGIDYTNTNKIYVSSQELPAPTANRTPGDLWLIPETGQINFFDGTNWISASTNDNIGIVEYKKGTQAEPNTLWSYNGQIYRKTTNIVTLFGPDSDYSNWVRITRDEEEPLYDSNRIYYPGDIVKYGNFFYISIKKGNVVPVNGITINDAYWMPLATTYKNSLGRWLPAKHTEDNLTVRMYMYGDIVNYDGNLYRNKTGTNTSTPPSTDTANWELIKEKFTVYPPYDSSKTGGYTPGDKIQGTPGSSYYINITATNLSPGVSPGSWKEVVFEENVLPEWFEEKRNKFVIDDIINYNGVLYRNMTGKNHAKYTPDLDSENWIRTENANLVNILNNYRGANAGTLVSDSDNLFRVISGLTGADLASQQASYIIESADESMRHRIPAWIPSSKYVRGDIISFRGGLYVNVSGLNNRILTPYQDEKNWFSIKKYNNHFNGLINYDMGDVVYFNGNFYTNTTGNNTITTPDVDNANWLIVPTIKNNIRYFNNTADMFGTYINYGEDWKIGDLCVVASVRCMYYFTGNFATPLRLVEENAYVAITEGWKELMTYFPAGSFTEGELALVKTSIGNETPEFSEYKANPTIHSWDAVDEKRHAKVVATSYEAWNTKWQYSPNIIDLPVGSNLHIVTSQKTIGRVENWDPALLAWDNGAYLTREPIYGNYGYLTGSEFFDDPHLKAYLRHKQDQNQHSSADQNGVRMYSTAYAGNGWFPKGPWLDDATILVSVRNGRAFEDRASYTNSRGFQGGFAQGFRCGQKGMALRYIDAPWWNMSMDRNRTNEIGTSFKSDIPGYGTYFYGFAPSYASYEEFASKGYPISYRYQNSSYLKYDGSYEFDRKEYNWYKSVTGGDIIRGLPRENNCPRVYGNPTSVLEEDITYIKDFVDSHTDSEHTDRSVSVLVKYRPTDFTKKVYKTSSDSDIMMKVTASSHRTSWFTKQHPDSYPFTVAGQGTETVTGEFESYRTGDLASGLYFNNKRPRVGKTYTVNGVNLTVKESDSEYWNFWDLDERSGKYWQPHILDQDPSLTFQLANPGEKLFLTGLNIMPCAPYGAFDSEHDAVVSEFIVTLFNTVNGRQEVKSFTLNSLRDSLREYNPNASLTKNSNLMYFDCTMMLNNRDYRAYRNAEFASQTDPGDDGIEFRAGHVCDYFTIRPANPVRNDQTTVPTYITMGRIVPLFSRWKSINQVEDNDGSHILGTGDLDMMSRWVKVGRGIQTNQTNSWKRIGPPMKPNEKIMMRDKVAPDIYGLQRWPEQAAFYIDKMIRPITSSSFETLEPRIYDNRLMNPEGSDTNYTNTEKETATSIADYESKKKASEWDFVANILDMMAMAFQLSPIASVIFGFVFAPFTGGLSWLATVGAAVAYLPLTITSYVLQGVAMGLSWTVGTMDDIMHSINDDQPGYYGGMSGEEATREVALSIFGMASVLLDFIPDGGIDFVIKAIEKTVSVATKATKGIKALKAIAKVLKGINFVLDLPGLILDKLAWPLKKLGAFADGKLSALSKYRGFKEIWEEMLSGVPTKVMTKRRGLRGQQLRKKGGITYDFDFVTKPGEVPDFNKWREYDNMVIRKNVQKQIEEVTTRLPTPPDRVLRTLREESIDSIKSDPVISGPDWPLDMDDITMDYQTIKHVNIGIIPPSIAEQLRSGQTVGEVLFFEEKLRAGAAVWDRVHKRVFEAAKNELLAAHGLTSVDLTTPLGKAIQKNANLIADKAALEATENLKGFHFWGDKHREFKQQGKLAAASSVYSDSTNIAKKKYTPVKGKKGHLAGLTEEEKAIRDGVQFKVNPSIVGEFKMYADGGVAFRYANNRLTAGGHTGYQYIKIGSIEGLDVSNINIAAAAGNAQLVEAPKGIKSRLEQMIDQIDVDIITPGGHKKLAFPETPPGIVSPKFILGKGDASISTKLPGGKTNYKGTNIITDMDRSITPAPAPWNKTPVKEPMPTINEKVGTKAGFSNKMPKKGTVDDLTDLKKPLLDTIKTKDQVAYDHAVKLYNKNKQTLIRARAKGLADEWDKAELLDEARRAVHATSAEDLARRAFAAEVDRATDAHRAKLSTTYIAQGMTPADARTQAIQDAAKWKDDLIKAEEAKYLNKTDDSQILKYFKAYESKSLANQKAVNKHTALTRATQDVESNAQLYIQDLQDEIIRRFNALPTAADLKRVLDTKLGDDIVTDEILAARKVKTDANPHHKEIIEKITAEAMAKAQIKNKEVFEAEYQKELNRWRNGDNDGQLRAQAKEDAKAFYDLEFNKEFNNRWAPKKDTIEAKEMRQKYQRRYRGEYTTDAELIAKAKLDEAAEPWVKKLEIKHKNNEKWFYEKLASGGEKAFKTNAKKAAQLKANEAVDTFINEYIHTRYREEQEKLMGISTVRTDSKMHTGKHGGAGNTFEVKRQPGNFSRTNSIINTHFSKFKMKAYADNLLSTGAADLKKARMEAELFANNKATLAKQQALNEKNLEAVTLANAKGYSAGSRQFDDAVQGYMKTPKVLEYIKTKTDEAWRKAFNEKYLALINVNSKLSLKKADKVAKEKMDSVKKFVVNGENIDDEAVTRVFNTLYNREIIEAFNPSLKSWLDSVDGKKNWKPLEDTYTPKGDGTFDLVQNPGNTGDMLDYKTSTKVTETNQTNVFSTVKANSTEETKKAMYGDVYHEQHMVDAKIQALKDEIEALKKFRQGEIDLGATDGPWYSKTDGEIGAIAIQNVETVYPDVSNTSNVAAKWKSDIAKQAEVVHATEQFMTHFKEVSNFNLKYDLVADSLSKFYQQKVYTKFSDWVDNQITLNPTTDLWETMTGIKNTNITALNKQGMDILSNYVDVNAYNETFKALDKAYGSTLKVDYEDNISKFINDIDDNYLAKWETDFDDKLDNIATDLNVSVDDQVWFKHYKQAYKNAFSEMKGLSDVNTIENAVDTALKKYLKSITQGNTTAVLEEFVDAEIAFWIKSKEIYADKFAREVATRYMMNAKYGVTKENLVSNIMRNSIDENVLKLHKEVYNDEIVSKFTDEFNPANTSSTFNQNNDRMLKDVWNDTAAPVSFDEYMFKRRTEIAFKNITQAHRTKYTNKTDDLVAEFVAKDAAEFAKIRNIPLPTSLRKSNISTYGDLLDAQEVMYWSNRLYELAIDDLASEIKFFKNHLTGFDNLTIDKQKFIDDFASEYKAKLEELKDPGNFDYDSITQYKNFKADVDNALSDIYAGRDWNGQTAEFRSKYYGVITDTWNPILERIVAEKIYGDYFKKMTNIYRREALKFATTNQNAFAQLIYKFNFNPAKAQEFKINYSEDFISNFKKDIDILEDGTDPFTDHIREQELLIGGEGTLFEMSDEIDTNNYTALRMSAVSTSEIWGFGEFRRLVKEGKIDGSWDSIVARYPAGTSEADILKAMQSDAVLFSKFLKMPLDTTNNRTLTGAITNQNYYDEVMIKEFYDDISYWLTSTVDNYVDSLSNDIVKRLKLDDKATQKFKDDFKKAYENSIKENNVLSSQTKVLLDDTKTQANNIAMEMMAGDATDHKYFKMAEARFKNPSTGNWDGEDLRTFLQDALIVDLVMSPGKLDLYRSSALAKANTNASITASQSGINRNFNADLIYDANYNEDLIRVLKQDILLDPNTQWNSKVIVGNNIDIKGNLDIGFKAMSNRFKAEADDLKTLLANGDFGNIDTLMKAYNANSLDDLYTKWSAIPHNYTTFITTPLPPNRQTKDIITYGDLGDYAIDEFLHNELVDSLVKRSDEIGTEMLLAQAKKLNIGDDKAKNQKWVKKFSEGMKEEFNNYFKRHSDYTKDIITVANAKSKTAFDNVLKNGAGYDNLSNFDIRNKFFKDGKWLEDQLFIYIEFQETRKLFQSKLDVFKSRAAKFADNEMAKFKALIVGDGSFKGSTNTAGGTPSNGSATNITGANDELLMRAELVERATNLSNEMYDKAFFSKFKTAQEEVKAKLDLMDDKVLNDIGNEAISVENKTFNDTWNALYKPAYDAKYDELKNAYPHLTPKELDVQAHNLVFDAVNDKATSEALLKKVEFHEFEIQNYMKWKVTESNRIAESIADAYADTVRANVYTQAMSISDEVSFNEIYNYEITTTESGTKVTVDIKWDKIVGNSNPKKLYDLTDSTKFTDVDKAAFLGRFNLDNPYVNPKWRWDSGNAGGGSLSALGEMYYGTLNRIALQILRGTKSTYSDWSTQYNKNMFRIPLPYIVPEEWNPHALDYIA